MDIQVAFDRKARPFSDRAFLLRSEQLSFLFVIPTPLHSLPRSVLSHAMLRCALCNNGGCANQGQTSNISSLDLLPSGMICSVDGWLVIDVSAQPIGPTSTLEEGTDRLSRNVSN